MSDIRSWISCEECGKETLDIKGKPVPDNCIHCGAYLWEDEEPADLPQALAKFSRDL